jgi:hypothetical protein
LSNVAASESFVQQEALQFNQPVSESAASSIAALANAMREICNPIGSIIASMLTEVQFQAQNGGPSPSRWILADGRSVVGSRYASLTGNSNVPDLRGVLLRGKNNGRSGATGNPDGDLTLGTYQADQFGSHNHGFSDPGHAHALTQSQIFRQDNYSGGDELGAWDITGSSFSQGVASNTTGISFSANGGNETRGRNVTVNYFIRIN